MQDFILTSHSSSGLEASLPGAGANLRKRWPGACFSSATATFLPPTSGVFDICSFLPMPCTQATLRTVARISLLKAEISVFSVHFLLLRRRSYGFCFPCRFFLSCQKHPSPRSTHLCMECHLLISVSSTGPRHSHLSSWEHVLVSAPLPEGLFLGCPHALLVLSAGSFQWDPTQLCLCTSLGSTEPSHPLLSLPWYLSVTFQHTESFYSFTALRDCYLSQLIGRPSSGGSAVSFIPCSPPGDVYHLTEMHTVVRKQPTRLSDVIRLFFSRLSGNKRIVFISDF